MIKRNIHNKKGMFSDIQMAILAVAAIIILVIFANKVYVGMKEKLMTSSCKDSIEAHRILASTTDGEFFSDIKCPTKEIRIKSLKTAKETIAEDMHRCWYIWNKGDGRYFEGEGTFCHICSVYRFQEPERKVEGMAKYLATASIKVKYPGDRPGISYMDYFQGFETPNSAKLVSQSSYNNIESSDYLNTSQRYATIFVYASGKTAITTMLEGGGKSTLTATGGTLAIVGGLAGGLGIATAIGIANVWNPIGWFTLAGVGITAGGIALYTAFFGDSDPEWVSFIVLREYNQETLETLGCQYIDINQESNKARG
jgi:hypothetical protein